MKDLIEKLRNIWKIEELRQRIIYTLLLLGVFRLGSYVILPGIDSVQLEAAFNNSQGGGILDFINLFVGGAFARGAIFALGIMPYISASIIVQLLGAALPSIQKLQREGDSGQKKINQLTRYLTVLITLGQSAGYVVNLRSMYPTAVPQGDLFFWLTAVLILTAGTMFLVWLGERITDNGVGNGVSLLIAIGIISALPGSLINEFRSNTPMLFFVELIALGVATMAVVALTQATRKIPINYARRVMGNRIAGGMTNNARQYIPLKVNSSGVMPIIFAQSIMFIPATIATFFPESSFWTSTGNAFGDINGVLYNMVFAFLIIVFTYFYTAIVINPNDIADNLKRTGGFIPGVKPGKKTADYIDTILSRITLPGSIALAFVAVFPAFASAMGVSQAFAQFFGGTSLLIMIGVVLDTLQQIESYLLMRHYDGLMKQGRIRKNQGAPGVSV
ncbi:MAG: preprotein translocase subunit SecY [Bacteroidota bacterium]